MGVPFPGRLMLVVGGALSTGTADTALMVLLAGAGAVAGDHVLYLLGTFGGDRVLRLYCRLSLGSARCIQNARDYFERFGGATIVIGRFVMGVRIFAAALAGAGGIPYYRFFLFDALGGLVWAGLFVVLGHLLGHQAARLLERFGHVALVVGLVVVLAPLLTIAARLWRRRRHRPAAMARTRGPRR